MVVGSLWILEGTQSRHRFSGLRHGEDVRAGGSAPLALGRCGNHFIGPESGNTATTSAEKAPARLPVLTNDAIRQPVVWVDTFADGVTIGGMGCSQQLSVNAARLGMIEC